MLELRPYQQKLMDDVRYTLRTHQSACVQLSTGGGKTAIAGAMTLGMVRKMSTMGDEHILYLVHRRELLDQVCNTLHDLEVGDLVGKIAAGHAMAPWQPLQVASVQTLTRRVGGPETAWLRPKVVFIDEAHHARASTWEKVLHAFPKARRIGLTATPARLDGKGLGTLFDAIVEGPPMRTLIGQGYLADIDIYSPEGVDLKGVHRRMGEYSKKELDQRMGGAVVAKIAENWYRIAPRARTIHYAVTRRHSQAFVDKVRSWGVDAEHVDGTTPKEERDAVFRRFHNGVTQLVSNVDLVTEGFDCPACDCIIMRPTASLTHYLQMNGRMMRPKDDGRNGIMIDPGGNLARHGDPRDPYQWTLDGGIEWEVESSATTRHRICKSCGFYYPISHDACPACGYVNPTKPVHEVDVELKKVDGAHLDKVKKRRQAAVSRRELTNLILETGGDYQKLKALEKKYGYKNGFARHWAKSFRKVFRRPYTGRPMG